MPTSARAAVSINGSVEVRDVEVRDPHPGEVLVEMKASGVCHTDYDVMQAPIHIVLGHEGAGVVRAVGTGVTGVEPGQAVMLNWAMPCGRCYQCAIGNQHLCEQHNPVVGTRRREDRRNDTTLDGTPVLRAFDLGTMSTHSCVRAEAVTPLTIDIPFPSAAIIGCGVMTGFGSVVNCAKVPAGSSVVVIGCGGVGLSAIQAARIAGAGSIVAVDLKDRRLEMATRVGATHLIKPDVADTSLEAVARNVRELTGGRGADFAFESTGVPALAATPLRMIRHGGLAVQISGTEQDITIDMRLFEFDKSYINPLYGQCVPARDFPRLLALYAQGKLLLDEIVTSTYPLDDVATAFADLLAGTGAKGCLVFE